MASSIKSFKIHTKYESYFYHIISWLKTHLINNNSMRKVLWNILFCISVLTKFRTFCIEFKKFLHDLNTKEWYIHLPLESCWALKKESQYHNQYFISKKILLLLVLRGFYTICKTNRYAILLKFTLTFFLN